MSKGFFVTGTDTGVGKTIVAGVLIKAVRLSGLSACGMKPIESGCTKRGSMFLPADGMFLKETARMEESLSYVTPCCLEQPLAPFIAAEREGRKIDISNILRRFKALTERYGAVVVEGIGGLRVPIKANYFVADLAYDMGLPLVIVASPFLGTINHTLLTLDCAFAKKLKVAGIVINHMRQGDGNAAEETNPSAIERLSPVPLLGVVPYLSDTGGDALEKAALKYLDMSAIKRLLR